jgi:hypothetical protein
MTAADPGPATGHTPTAADPGSATGYTPAAADPGPATGYMPAAADPVLDEPGPPPPTDRLPQWQPLAEQPPTEQQPSWSTSPPPTGQPSWSTELPPEQPPSWPTRQPPPRAPEQPPGRPPADPPGRPADRPPAAAAEPARGHGGAHTRLDGRGTQLSWYVPLILMAGGDAFGIYTVLLTIFLSNTPLVILFTAALTIGSVAVAHEIGRLARRRQEALGGHPAWIAALALPWLGLGLSITWLRLTHPPNQPLPGFGGSTPVATAPISTEAMQIAVLLLTLYLLTGALAISTAYRFGSRRQAELRRLLRERERVNREATDLAYDVDRTTALAAHVATERERVAEEHLQGAGLETFGVYLRDRAALHQAGLLGDPQATDELVPPRPQA